LERSVREEGEGEKVRVRFHEAIVAGKLDRVAQVEPPSSEYS
jgi:hypothetical protein